MQLAQARTARPIATDRPARPVQDVSGYTIFSVGDVGAAHIVAHQMLDEGRFAEGYRRLGAWLEGRSGSGSEWIHIQFHMAVFEIELGLLSSAYARFATYVLPAAATSSDALTDGPGLAWRLSLATGSPPSFPWGPIRLRAVSRLRRIDDPYVDLHNALALAGAGDLDNLARWFDSRGSRTTTRIDRLVLRVARALASYAEGDFCAASRGLSEVLSLIPRIGGSSAQNRLFAQIERAARRRIPSDLDPGAVAAAA